jgi:ribosome maturation factor RimP
MSVVDDITKLVEPICAELDVELYDLTYTGSVLQISLEQGGGVDVEILKKLSRQVSELLDEHDPIPGRFTLEVTTPGLERPLRTPAHYVGAIGDEVSIKTNPGVEGDRRVNGVLRAANDQQVTVGEGDSARSLVYEDILKARTVFVWESAPKPGKGTTTSSKTESEAREAVTP